MKNKTGAPEKYDAAFIKRLEFFTDDPRPLCTKNIISNVLIAKLLKVSKESVRRWRTVGSEHYQKAFKKAIDSLQNIIFAGDIKIGLIERAKGFKQHKFTQELQRTEIILPALSKLSVKRLHDYARTEMHLKFEKGIPRAIIESMIHQAAEKMTKSKLIIVKHEITDVAADPVAASKVLPNIEKGNPDAWQFSNDVNVNVTNLADIAAVMTAKRKK